MKKEEKIVYLHCDQPACPECTKAAYEAGAKAERERVVEWAKMHDMPKNMSDDTLAGYNEALTRLVVSHITI